MVFAEPLDKQNKAIRVPDVNQQTIVNLAKIRPPQYAIPLTIRECLGRLKDAHRYGHHCLVTASAGFGKTCLLVQHHNFLQAQGEQVAWLSLSDADTDPVHFLAGISSAIQTLTGNIGIASQALIAAGFVTSYQVILTSLINEILTSGQSITLFLDDLHRAQSGQTEALMQELMGSGPQNLSLVIASRTACSKFGRLRARNKLCDLSTEDLRVTFDEASQVLAESISQEISSENIGALLERVDGWINGLQIAALSIDNKTDIEEYIKSFKANVTDFSNYLEHDIFARLPRSLRTFLVDTSILEILTPELCDAVTQRDDSEANLNQLQQMNLFLVTLDEQIRCYRYHQVFRDFLRAKLSAKSVDDLHSVHWRAFQWCMSNDLRREAINHIVAIEDWESAADAIESSLELALSRNRLPTLERWIRKLPVAVLDTRPQLLLGLGWIAVLCRNFLSAQQYLDKAENLFTSARGNKNLSSDLEIKIWSNIEALKSVITVISDDSARITQLAATREIKIPKQQAFFRDCYLASLVYSLMYCGQFDEGHRLAIDKEISGKSDNFRAKVYMHIFRGLGYRLAGNFQQAIEQYEQSKRIAGQKFGDQWVPFMVPGALMAEIYFEWGDHAKAAEYVRNRSVVRNEASVIEPLLCLYEVAARLAMSEGNVENALELLAEGESVGRQDQFDRLVAAMLSERIRLLIAAGNLEPAAAAHADIQALDSEAGSQGRKRDSWSELFYYIDMGRSRYFLGTQKPKEALSLLSRQASLAKRQGQNRYLPKILLLEACALQQLGKHRSVINRISEAIRLAAKGGIVQTFLDAERQLDDPIKKALARWPVDDELNRSNEGAAYLSRLRDKIGVEEAVGEEDEIDIEIANIDPLTPREFELLRLLAKGLKNKELANEMHVSHHTIAWHLKNLFSKLQVDNRTAAVTVARQLRL